MAATGDPRRAGEERRDEGRVPILGELRGEVMVFQPMAITEIGRVGLQIETRFPFQINSLHELRLSLGDDSIIVKGRITHCSIIDVDQESVRYRSGIQFTEMPDRVYEVIAAFVDAIKEPPRR